MPLQMMKQDEGEIEMASENKTVRASFSSGLGYVLSAAGSAVGLGNIWRFPYLAAKYGGGIFLITYLILVFTFGYTLIMSETAIGRMSHKSPVGAFGYFGHTPFTRFGGWINAIIPMIIVPYYCTIGGWVLRYLFGYVGGGVKAMAGDNYFSRFTADGGSVEFWFVIFAAATVVVILLGVQNGIEKVSSVMMPILVVLAIIVAIYSVTRPGALAGVKYFLIPNIKDFSWMTVVTAIGQMFYSLSCAMGILITFGSYMHKDISIEKSTGRVEIFDTLIAILAGLMIIPAVFAFSGDNAAEGLQAGPSLMFITMPKVFGSMGFGTIIGIVFFMLVFLAALTSSIALAESVVSTFEDELHWKRTPSTLLTGVIIFVLGTLSSLGFNLLKNVKPLNMDFLDFFDFISNSVMMPIAAMATCILILRRVGLKRLEEEVTQGGAPFKRKRVYTFILKYLSIAFLAIILISSVLNVLGIIHM